MTCVTHHYACECREAKFEAVVKALRALVDKMPRGENLSAYHAGYEVHHARAALAALESEK